MRLTLGLVAALAASTLAPATSRAFCGFYINSDGGQMFASATQVVLMREGTRTVLSMQNNYVGPPADFAMVVPVPVVLHEGDVKTLPKAVFAAVDAMSSPRLVEYWERDPCTEDVEVDARDFAKHKKRSADFAGDDIEAATRRGVTIEAQFDVGEYQIVILSAKDSTGLDAYLREQHYQIPAGAEPLLRPYVESGMKFFVAKVDPKKVQFVDGQAQLSPLRFHYDSDEFSLPIRLGLANSAGTQDLIVNILAPAQRYELANYPNVTIPTNFDVVDDVRTHFAAFYASLFDRTVQKNPGAVVTEYAWDASTCDPCPGPRLQKSDFETLGMDVVGGGGGGTGRGGRLTLTRLHARYGKDGVPNDLVFKAAPPIVGGREHMSGGSLEHGAEPDRTNNFQARYAIRHAWTGAITCDNPQRGRWGGPPDAQNTRAKATVATNLAAAPRGTFQLADAIVRDIPEIDVQVGVPLPLVVPPPMPVPTAAAVAVPQGCGCDTTDSPAGGFALVGFTLLALHRSKRNA